MIPDDACSVQIQVAGLQHSVRFRLRSGTLEVYAYGEMRSAPVAGLSLDDLCVTLRELLADIVLQKIRAAWIHSDADAQGAPAADF